MFFYSLLFLIYLIRTLRNLFYHLFWWERKEYRFDRMLVHLRETYQGKKWMFGWVALIKWFLLIFSFLGNVDYFIYFVFFLESVKNVFELKTGWRRPSIRGRIIIISSSTILSLLFIFFLLINKGFRIALSLLILDKLLGLITVLFIFVSNIVFRLYKNYKIKKAKEKISKAGHIKVIGITGSYGKTTTKELIAQLLAEKYSVFKTLGSQNTDIGIAERILSTDLFKYDYFVCEVAAYKRGEIVDICKIFKNKLIVAVITGINEQHQSLFGSLENTKKAKYELVEALNEGRIVVFNTNSRYINDLIFWAKKAKQKRIRVIPVRNIVGMLPKDIHGQHFKENLSLAITVASLLGLNDFEIKKGVKKLRLLRKTMHVIRKGSLMIIDNTFNSNPDGVYAALNYLKRLKGPKFFVLQPLIELGSYSKEVHRKIGQLADKICDKIILTNRNFFDSVIEGVSDKSKVVIGKLSKISKGVILFQGKEAENYLKLIKTSQDYD